MSDSSQQAVYPEESARALDEAPFLDTFDPAFQADPDSVVGALRRQSPVLRSPLGPVVVSREHVHTGLLDPTMHSALLHFVRLQGVADGPLHDLAVSSLLGLEGEDHARVRRLVARSFTPRAADAHRPFMRELVKELVGGWAASGECEFMADFADHYPVQVIAHLMGVPRQDHPLFARWGDALTHLLSLELSTHRQAVEAAQVELVAYLEELVADRRRHPRADLVSELIAARDGEERLSDQELLALLGGLLFAGYDTTRNQLAVAMTVYSAHPEQWERLGARPDSAAVAVEEIMRFAGVVGTVPRVTTRDTIIAGWLVPAGTLVSLSIARAHRDPEIYPEPDRFRPEVPQPVPQLGFGGGHHHCLGANLARAEMQEALPLLARAMPGMRVAEQPEWRSPLTGIAGPLRLHLRFDPPSTTLSPQ